MVKRNFIKTFENLNAEEKEYLTSLKSYGFSVENKFDSTGHLYYCKLELPFYVLELDPNSTANYRDRKTSFIKSIKNKEDIYFSMIINTGKSTISYPNGNTFESISGDFLTDPGWKFNRDIDNQLQFFLNAFEKTYIPLLYEKIGLILKAMSQDEINNKRIDYVTSEQINNLW